MEFTCSKCDKSLSSKSYLEKHEVKCNGLNKLQCELCHKNFSSKQSKSKHKKLKVCERNGTIIDNSINNSYNNNHIDNSIHIQNLTINFGEEKLELDNEFVDKCISLNFKGIIDMIKKIYFSDPTNQTIKKENKRDEFIDIMSNGDWEKEFKNIVIHKVLNKSLSPMTKRIIQRNRVITEENNGPARKELIDDVEPYLITLDLLNQKVKELRKLCYYDENESLKNKEQRRKKIFKVIDELIYNETQRLSNSQNNI